MAVVVLPDELVVDVDCVGGIVLVKSVGVVVTNLGAATHRNSLAVLQSTILH